MPYPRVCTKLFVLGVLNAAACAPSLSTMQPAHVIGKRRARAVAAMEVGAPVGVVDDLVARGKTLASAADDGRALTDAEKLQIFDAGIGLMAAPPFAAPLFALTYGLLDWLEVDARYAGSGVRGGARAQILDRAKAPFDLTVGLGFARATVDIPLADSLPGLSVDGFGRHTLDASALIGTSRDFWRVWAGPRVAWSWFHSGLGLRLPNEPALAAQFDGRALYLGGQAGAAVGYRKVFLVAELTIVGLSGHADAGVIGSIAPMGRRVDLDATVVQPSFGIMGEL